MFCFLRSFGVHTRPRVAFARSRAYQTAPSILIRRSLCRRREQRFLHKTKQPPRGSARRLFCYNCVEEGADFSTALPPQSYRFSTTWGAGLIISIWALTFWICAACSLRLAVRALISPSCKAMVACCFSVVAFNCCTV